MLFKRLYYCFGTLLPSDISLNSGLGIRCIFNNICKESTLSILALLFSLAKTIIEKLVELSSISGETNILDVIEEDVGCRVNISQLILHQLQGLNTIADGPALVNILKENFE